MSLKALGIVPNHIVSKRNIRLPEFKAITALKDVKAVKRTEMLTLRVTFGASAKTQYRVLRGILNSGVKVVSYTPQWAAIEDFYLQLVPEGEA
jgi:hypothetical protein